MGELISDAPVEWKEVGVRAGKAAAPAGPAAT